MNVTQSKILAVLKNAPGDEPLLSKLFGAVADVRSRSDGRLELRWVPIGPALVGAGSVDTLDSVRADAEQFIQAVNGVLGLEPGASLGVRVSEWWYADEAGVERPLPPPAPGGLVYVPDPDDAWPLRATYVEAAFHDEPARRALRFVCHALDWVSLYKAYEVVRIDIGGDAAISSLGVASMAAVRRFKRTANDYGSIGDKARHGVQLGDPHLDPLPLNEARWFVQGLVKRWLHLVVLPRVLRHTTR